MQLLQVIRQLYIYTKTWIYPAWYHSKRIFLLKDGTYEDIIPSLSSFDPFLIFLFLKAAIPDS